MSRRDPDPSSLLPLTPAVTHILLALATGDAHGYAIAKEVEELTEGQIRMGPGTLYGSIGRMIDAGLIEESPRRPRSGDDERRRYYRATLLGRRALERELRRLERVVAVARARRVLGRPEPA
ncbi:MAG TPA: helix-turn-helix transcriptional regulator [Gemmatimonadaceae bacterium]